MNLELNEKIPKLGKLEIYDKVSDILKGVLISAIIFTIFLFVLESSIKNLFYIFGLSLSTILIFFVYKNDLKFNLSIPSRKLVDYFLITCSIIAFISGIYFEPGGNVLFPLSIIVSFFLPGWVLLRVLNIKYFQKPCLADLCLSFVLSVGLSSLIFMIISQTGLETGIGIFVIYTIISFLPVLVDKFSNQRENSPSKFFQKREFRIFEIAILFWITAFFVTVVSIIYPQTSFVPGHDIVGHFFISNQLINNPEFFGSVYPIYHSFLATINILSSVPMWLFQSSIAYLSIIAVFSFYIMAKSYLKEINTHAPLVATIFFFIFSGFGWMYFITQRLLEVGLENYFRLLLSTSTISYLDTSLSQGTWLWLWFRPITLGFAILFVLIYLLKNDSLSKRNYVIITSLLISSLAGIHFPELVIFTLLIFVLTVFKPKAQLHLKETAISILIGLIIWSGFLFLYQQFFDQQYEAFTIQFLSMLLILSGISIALITFDKRPSFTLKINPILVTLAALSVYIILLFFWYFGIDEGPRFTFKPDYAVPFEYYPVLLGIVGGFAIGGAIIVIKKYRNRPIILFLILFILSLVVGNLITYVNSNFFDTGYFERRMVLFVYVSATILASIAFFYILNGISKINYRILKSLFYGFIISSIIMAGVFSTFLTIEYQHLRLPKISMSADEFFLQSHLEHVDSDSILLTVTDRSKNIAEFGNLGDIVNQYRHPLWASKNPEQTLNVLSTLNSSTIIYLNPKDSQEISKKFENGYINSHLLRMASPLYDGPEGKITQIPSVSSPSSKSQVALVLPEDYEEFYYVYDILSLGGYNYTTILLSDLNSLNKVRVMITPNEEMALKIIEYRTKYDLKFEKLIVLNVGGYGTILFEKQSSFLSDKIISTENNNKITFPNNLNVNEVVTDSDFEIKAQYHPNVPFHFYKQYDGFDLNYFDLNPMIEKLNSGDINSREFYLYLGKILHFSEVELPVSELEHISRFAPFSKGVYAFKSVICQGDLNLQADSTIINLKNNSLIVNLLNSKLEFEDVIQVVPINIDNVSVNSTNGLLKDGRGFYSQVSLNQSSVHFVGTPAIISVFDSKGDEHSISSEEIEIILPESTFLIRQPKVTCDGILKFENFYGFGKVSRNVRFNDENFQITGQVILNNKLSDVFTISTNNSFKGKISLLLNNE